MYGCFDLAVGPDWHAAPIPAWPQARMQLDWPYSQAQADFVLITPCTGRIYITPAHPLAGAELTAAYHYKEPASGRPLR